MNQPLQFAEDAVVLRDRLSKLSEGQPFGSAAANTLLAASHAVGACIEHLPISPAMQSILVALQQGKDGKV